MSRRRKEIMKRGPPFIIVDGVPHLNLSFDLNPMGGDIRERVADELGLKAQELHVFRRLSKCEAELFRTLFDDAEVEAWARVVGYR